MKKLFFILIAAICFISACRKEEQSEDAKRLEKAVAALKNTFLPSGSTRYQINLENDEDADAGAYAIRLILPGKTMAQIAYVTGDKTLLPLASNNFVWAEGNSSYIGKGLCFDSDESGAAAVMLMEEMFYEKASGDQEYAHLKKPILRCLRDTYFDKNYGFREVRHKDGPHPFYDGETWLALALYTDFFPEDRKNGDWIKIVDDIIMRSYREKSHEIKRFFHWGAQAAAQRYKTTKDPKFLDFLKYMFAQIQQDMPVRYIENNMNACTYSEGLADLIEVMDDPKIRQEALERFDRQMQGVRKLQLSTTTLPDGNPMHPYAGKYVGLFHNRPNDFIVMPDTAQHCAVALMKASRLKSYGTYLKQKASRKEKPTKAKEKP